MPMINYFIRDSSELWGYSARVLNAWKDGGNTWYSSQVSPCRAELILGNIKLDYSFLLYTKIALKTVNWNKSFIMPFLYKHEGMRCHAF